MKRIVMLIDVNNAFLSWTAVDLLKHGHKDIRNIPSVVGYFSQTRHGMVLAKSEPAKKCGVKTTDPFFLARKKCPGIESYQPNFKLYEDMSKNFYEILLNYSPDVEQASIDECFLEYTGLEKLFGDPVEAALKIQREISELYGFTVNIGIGNSKLCAKMASNLIKPNKVSTIFENEIEAKMWPLAIEELYFVGRQTTPKLKMLGINTIGDLANFDVTVLQNRFKNVGLSLKNHANGIDNTLVKQKVEAKGIGKEVTFDSLKNDIEYFNEVLRELTFEVATSLRKSNLHAKCVTIIYKDVSLKRKSHQRKFKNGTNLSEELFLLAKELFKNAWNKNDLRLLGIRFSDFSNMREDQISLFDNVTNKENDIKLQKAMDKLNEKYGHKTINNAVFYKN